CAWQKGNRSGYLSGKAGRSPAGAARPGKPPAAALSQNRSGRGRGAATPTNPAHTTLPAPAAAQSLLHATTRNVTRPTTKDPSSTPIQKRSHELHKNVKSVAS